MLDEKQQFPYAACKLFEGKNILVLAPHPDDEIFGCGGALALHAKRGDQIMIAIITDGGGNGSCVELRKQESRKAAQVIGAPPPEFWDLPDRGLSGLPELSTLILEAINKFKVDLLYLPSPSEIHPDHRATSLATMDAIVSLKKDIGLAFYEIGIPVRPTHLLDITRVATVKSSAAECFASQNSLQNYYLQINGLNKFRTYTLPAPVQLAEAYVYTRSSLLEKGYWPFPADLGAQIAHEKITRGSELEHCSETLSLKDHDENHVLTEALAHARQELLALKNSKSWKITRPLRQLSELLRKLCRKNDQSSR